MWNFKPPVQRDVRRKTRACSHCLPFCYIARSASSMALEDWKSCNHIHHCLAFCHQRNLRRRCSDMDEQRHKQISNLVRYMWASYLCILLSLYWRRKATKLIIGSTTALPAAGMCVCIRLYNACAARGKPSGKNPRNVIILEYGVCYAMPILFMALRKRINIWVDVSSLTVFQIILFKGIGSTSLRTLAAVLLPLSAFLELS